MAHDLQLLSAVPTVTAADVLASPKSRELCVIDLRTPAEFAEDHLPGAHNLPLFGDVQRAIVGTLYKQQSPDVAFERGAEFARERIAELVRAIAELADWHVPETQLESFFDAVTSQGLERLETALQARPFAQVPQAAVVLHCWRGGLRSKSVVAFLRALGLERAVGLAGGYKGYRACVRHELEAWRAQPTFVLRGLTGVGKTLVLRALEKLRPGWTLDLEGCAGHRSSLLGMVGLEPVGQKRFESLVADRLRARTGAVRRLPLPLVVEGESRKVGDAVIPESLWAALAGGTNYLLEAPLERRVRVLEEDYLADPASLPKLEEQLTSIEQRMGRTKYAGVLVGLLRAGASAELVKILLERYYDPLYRGSELGKHYAATIDASDPERAARQLAARIETELEDKHGDGR